MYPPYYPDILSLGTCPGEIRADAYTDTGTWNIHSSFMKTGNNPNTHNVWAIFFKL